MTQLTPTFEMTSDVPVRILSSLRVAIADDEPVMQEYFRATLSMLGHQVVAVAQTGCELIDQCQLSKPDLVITDVKMPEMDGIEAITKITIHCPVPVILVSAYHDAELIGRADQEFILAYLVKPIKQADLEAAIAIAVRRFKQIRVLSAAVATHNEVNEDDRTQLRCAKEYDRMDALRRIKRLSKRELEILSFIAEGVPNKNIAIGLSLSLRTVEKYRHSLFEALGVNSAAEATRIWVLSNLEN